MWDSFLQLKAPFKSEKNAFYAILTTVFILQKLKL